MATSIKLATPANLRYHFPPCDEELLPLSTFVEVHLTRSLVRQRRVAAPLFLVDPDLSTSRRPPQRRRPQLFQRLHISLTLVNNFDPPTPLK